jgi:regulator of replication initiation timing
MTPEEEVVALWAENALLREELARLRERLEVVEKKKRRHRSSCDRTRWRQRR